MNFFSDENTSQNSPPEETLFPTTLGLATRSPRRAQAPQHIQVGINDACERSARAVPLAAWSSIVPSIFEDEAPVPSALPHSLIVTGLNHSIEASKAIARLSSSFGKIVSVKFHEPATATVTFLTSENCTELQNFCSSNNVRLNGSDIQVTLAHRDEVVEPWLLAAMKQGRTRTVAAVFATAVDEDEVRGLFSQYCEVLSVEVSDARAIVETDAVSGATFAATMLNGPSITCTSIADKVHEKERVAMRPHELEAAEMSYKSVLELNLPAHYQDTGDVASGSERAWGDYKFVAGAKYSVDPEKVLHVTNYGPGTNSADLRAVFDPITKVDHIVMKKDYAFVNCASREHAVAGKSFADRHFALYVNGAPIRVRYSPTSAAAWPPRMIPCKNLYVCGLSPQVTQEALGELFSTFCRVKKVVLKPSQSFVFCFVNTMSIHEATVAMKALDGALFFGCHLKVRFAKDSTYENTESVGDEGGGDKYLTSDAVVGSEFGPDSDGCAKQGEAVAEEAPRDDGSADGDENSVCVEEAHSENSGSPSSRTNPPSSSIHVANIPDGTTENEIKHLFQRYCPVVSLPVKIRKVKDLRQYYSFEQPPRELYAFVNTPSVEDASRALELLQGHFLNGASLRLSFAREFNAAWQRPVHAYPRHELLHEPPQHTSQPRPPRTPYPARALPLPPLGLEDSRLFARVFASGKTFFGDADYFEAFCNASGLAASFTPPPAVYGGR